MTPTQPRTEAGKALLARKVHSSNWTNDQGTLLDGIAAIEEEAVSEYRNLLHAAHRGDWCQLPGEVWNAIDRLLQADQGDAAEPGR